MNKKKFFGLLAAGLIAAVATTNLNLVSNEKGLSGASLANIEALAIELPEVVVTCGASSGACWITSSMICYIGSYTYNWCDFDGSMWVSCTTKCK